jgi:hypothetical protein
MQNKWFYENGGPLEYFPRVLAKLCGIKESVVPFEIGIA